MKFSVSGFWHFPITRFFDCNRQTVGVINNNWQAAVSSRLQMNQNLIKRWRMLRRMSGTPLLLPANGTTNMLPVTSDFEG